MSTDPDDKIFHEKTGYHHENLIKIHEYHIKNKKKL